VPGKTSVAAAAAAAVLAAVAAAPPAAPRPVGFIGASFGMAARWGAAGAVAAATPAPSNKRPAPAPTTGAQPFAKAARSPAASGASSSVSVSDGSGWPRTSPLSPWYLAGGAPRFGKPHARPQWLVAHKAAEAASQLDARALAHAALVQAQQAGGEGLPPRLAHAARATDADWLRGDGDTVAGSPVAAGNVDAAMAGAATEPAASAVAGSEGSALETAAQERAAQRKFMDSLTAAILGHGGGARR
jgi:hypothetical protein